MKLWSFEVVLIHFAYYLFIYFVSVEKVVTGTKSASTEPVKISLKDCLACRYNSFSPMLLRNAESDERNEST